MLKGFNMGGVLFSLGCYVVFAGLLCLAYLLTN